MQHWIRTHCSRFDHGGCGLRVLVEDGVPVKVEPDRADPFSHGYSCPKGLASLERIQSPARLTRPLRRKGERGSGEWEAVSWEEALDLLATVYRDTMERHGPEALAFAQGAPKGLEFFVLLRLANLLRTPNVASYQHVCHMPREQMAMVTCGYFPVADLEHPTQCVVLWGSNPTHTNEEGVLGIHVTDSLKSGPALVVVDPMETDLARRADIWLRVRPGTDDLLAMGFLHILVEENLFDRDFVEKHTLGFEDLRGVVKDYTPERVSRGTWIPRERIIDAARLYGRSKPALIHWGNAIEHTVNSSQACRSLVLLMAVTGNLEVPGGNIRVQAPRTKRLGEFICLDQFPGRAEKLPSRHFGLMPRLVSVPNWVLVRSILDQSPYPVRCVYTQGTNPLVTYSNTREVRKAFLKLDFLAVADQVMTPTAAMADLVLPAATNFEFDDIGHYGLPHGVLLARPKVCEPRGECWPDMKILSEWGKRLGFEKYFWDDLRQPLNEVLEPSGLDYAAFAQAGMLKSARTYREYAEKGFPTPSRKVELRSGSLEKWGYAPLPHAREPQPLDADTPLLLTSRKPRTYFHSAYRQLDSLRERHPEPQVLIHPDTARSLGIEEGRPVRIVTATGSIVQGARLFSGMDPRVVVADFGWWFPERVQAPGSAEEANLNCLTSAGPNFDPVMGTTQMRALPCRLEPVS